MKNIIKSIIIFNIVLISFFGLGGQNLSYAGNKGGGNAGDSCESHFRSVSVDIYNWLSKSNGKLLKLPKNISATQYTEGMMTWIKSAKVICTSEQVYFSYARKDCRNFRKFEEAKKYLPQGATANSDDNGWIICNKKAIVDMDETKLYPLVAHEYAGLAGFEKNDGDISSNYEISRQYSSFLEDKIIKVLSTDIIPENITKDSFYTINDENSYNGRASFKEIKEMLLKFKRITASNRQIKVIDNKTYVDLIFDSPDNYSYILMRFEEFNDVTPFLATKVSVQKETYVSNNKPVVEALDICLMDRGYCPTIRVNIRTWNSFRNKIVVEWEATSKGDPDDDTYGFDFQYLERENAPPVWSATAWDDEEDSGGGIIFHFSSE